MWTCTLIILHVPVLATCSANSQWASKFHAAPGVDDENVHFNREILSTIVSSEAPKKAQVTDPIASGGLGHGDPLPNDNKCTLEDNVLQEIPRGPTSEWIIDSTALQQLNSDLQALVECVEPGAELRITVPGPIQFAKTITTKQNLTIVAVLDNAKHNAGAEDKLVTLLCPESGPFLDIRADDFVAVGINIEHCNNVTREAAIIVRSKTSTVFKDIAVKNNGVRALYVESDAHVTLENSLLENNTAWNGAGGAIYVDSQGSLAITSSTFSNNTVHSDGGAVHCDEAARAEVENSTFTNNRARYYGGALHFDEDAEAIVKHCAFTNNKARYDGGAISFLFRANATIASSSFTNNSVEEHAGAIYFDIDTRALVTGSMFKNNVAAQYGGAITIWRHVVVTIKNSKFIDNEALEDGGAIFGQGNTKAAIEDSKFTNNKAKKNGGAIHFWPDSTTTLKNSTFTNNKVKEYGGAIYFHSRTKATIRNTVFSNNKAKSEGGAIYFRPDATTSISNSTFISNEAKERGGAINYEANARTLIKASLLTNNIARGHGGAIHFWPSANATIRASTFKGNGGHAGGALYFVDARSGLVSGSLFVYNSAASTGGALFATHSQGIKIDMTNFTSNTAFNLAGAICVTNDSQLIMDSSSLVANYGSNGAGAIGVFDGSTFLCRSCVLETNKANWGGGLYIHANNTAPTIVQLQNCILENNSALHYGGGIDFFKPTKTSEECNESISESSRLVLLKTKISNNFANVSGSAILTTNLEDVFVACEAFTSHSMSFLSSREVTGMKTLLRDHLCDSWIGNHVQNSTVGKAIALYGRYLQVSTISTDDTHIIGNIESGFRLENAKTGYQFPAIFLTVVNGIDQERAPTKPNSIQVRLSSPSDLFTQFYPTNLTGGTGDFSRNGIISFKEPGYYELQITHDNLLLEELNITVHIRNCIVGEEQMDYYNMCRKCDPLSYNFNPTKDGNCTSCPENGKCIGNYIVPHKGYWHKSPCHSYIQKCFNDESCKYYNRSGILAAFTTEFKDCTMNSSVSKQYEHILCNKGYEGPLCGSCMRSYGLSEGYRCLECPSAASSVFTILFAVLYLWITAMFTVNGTLPVHPRVLRRMRAFSTMNTLDFYIPFPELGLDGSQSEDAPGALASHAVPQPPSTTSLEPMIPQQSECEIASWKTTEILKILLNFLQQTAIASTINVGWAKVLIDLFKVSEYVGALTAATASRPVDCLFSSGSKDDRSVWRLLIYVFISTTVIFLFAIIWLIVTIREKKTAEFFWKRLCLSSIVVLYISYLNLTKIAIKAFYCVEVHYSENYASDDRIAFWATDTAVRCYEKEHYVILLIGAIVLTVITICFPLFLALYLFASRGEVRDPKSFAMETMGFLFRAFKDKLAFWECLVMIRKACLSIIVVFSYPLGGQLQGSLATMVLFFFLYIHITYSPYREVFEEVSSYESLSLLLTGFTLLFGQFFESEKSSQSTKEGLALVVIIVNVSFVLFLVFALMQSVINQWRAVLISEREDIDADTPWWFVLKDYMCYMQESLSEATTRFFCRRRRRRY